MPRIRPKATPSCGQAAHQPAALLVAPLHRQQHRAAPLAADRDALQHAAAAISRIGRRSAPTSPAPGSRPIRAVEIPISSSVMIRVALRPIRSPQWPKIAAPTGRAANPTEYVANDSSWPA